jgi:type I restriction enzyme, R subunit
MNKKDLTERDICTKFITPAVNGAGWDPMAQIREQVYFTKGRIIVRGKLVTRGKPKFADYILYYKPNIPIALIEAKDNHHPVGGGMQQALDYAATLDIPFVFSSNGDAFLFHDRTGQSRQTETGLALDAFPKPEDLWAKYRAWKGLVPAEEEVVLQDYFDDGGKEPRYYQRIAINKATEAIAKGQNRVLLVMATGTGKTYTAFQILWRLWKAGRKKRILYLADRNVLIDQTMVNDFRPFGGAMAKLSTSSKTIEREDGAVVELPTAIDKRHRRIDTSYEIYLGLYQAITGPEDRQKL